MPGKTCIKARYNEIKDKGKINPILIYFLTWKFNNRVIEKVKNVRKHICRGKINPILKNFLTGKFNNRVIEKVKNVRKHICKGKRNSELKSFLNKEIQEQGY